VISSKRIVGKICIFTSCSCQLERFVQIKFGLRPDIWSDIEDKTEFWTDLDDQTKCLSSLENLCKLGLGTEFSLRTKSDQFFKSLNV